MGTYNILNGLAVASEQVRTETLTSAVRSLDADVLALQEVDRFQPRSGQADQAAVAATALGAQWWRFAPCLAGDPQGTWLPADPLSPPDGPAYGLALVSRLRLRDWRAMGFAAAPVPMPLRVPGRRGLVPVNDHPRLAVAAVAEGRDGPFTVVATHLSFVPGWNIRQLREITHWVADMPAPRLLLGDLNLPGEVPARTVRWTQLARVWTYPSWRPRVQWDHVLASGLGPHAAVAVTVHRLAVSDHAALTVDLDLSAEAAA